MTDLFDFGHASRDFAVIGNPVEHSKSPQIHSAFAQQFNIDIVYNRTQVDPGGFTQAVSHFAAHGGAGLNITVPFKVEAWQLCKTGKNTLSERATLAKAVNTLKIENDQCMFGDNTDGVGLLRDIQENLRVSLQNKKVLVLGAGGAVRGVLGPLLEQSPHSVCIVNRTAQKAIDLAAGFKALHASITGCGYRQLEIGPFDIIINGTAASLQGELPPLDNDCIHNDTLAYDMMYANQPTVFYAVGKICRSCNGERWSRHAG